MALNPYESTEVPVARSQDQIRTLLQSSGAAGVQFDEEWEPAPKCRVRFIWPLEHGQAVVRLEVTPLPPGDSEAARQARKRTYVDAAQRQRQAWRGIAWYLDGTLKAAAFGLVRFEDVFLSFIEDSKGRTIGDVLVPQIRAGQLTLPRGESDV